MPRRDHKIVRSPASSGVSVANESPDLQDHGGPTARTMAAPRNLIYSSMQERPQPMACSCTTLLAAGTFSRVETYHYFATDNVTGFESYTQSAGLQSSSGSFVNLSKGTIEINVWNAIGTNPSFLNASATSAQADQSVIVLFFSNATGSI